MLACDAFLVNLVGMVEQFGSDFEIGLTVDSGGTLVSGILVSTRTYSEGLVAALKAVNAELSSIADVEPAESSQPHPPDGSQPGRPACLHLRDVRCFSGGTVLSAPLWRARLDCIAGYAIGLPSKAGGAQ